MRSMQGGKLTQEKQMSPSNLNDATIHDEFNNETTQRRCPKAGYTEWNAWWRYCHFMGGKLKPIDPLNYNYTQKITCKKYELLVIYA